MVKYKKYDGDLLLTTACPIECEFCIYAASPKGEWMPEKTIRRVADQYAKNNIGIRISGGEPFYDFQKLEKCLDIVLEYQKPHEVLVITSGFFADVDKALRILTKRKIDTLVISVDRFHQEKVPFEHINRIVRIGKKKLKIIIRFTTDENSYDLMDKVAELIINEDITCEVHHTYGVYGKAEMLDSTFRIHSDKRKEYFEKRISDLASRKSVGSYYEQSPKRSQRDFAARFYPTTFPNGNVYGDSQCCKGSFMGNINEQTLKNLILKFTRTLPGYVLWSEKSDCSKRMPILLPQQEDYCEYCRNYPFKELSGEAIGRPFIALTCESNASKLIKRWKGTNRELLLFFSLKENDLNPDCGRRIVQLLEDFQENKIRFAISRPLPRCLFGFRYGEFIKRFNMPKDCYECRELFSVENLEIISCKPIAAKGPNIKYMEDRRQIWEFFNTLRLMKKPCKKCTACKYYLRNLCDCLCYRA